MSAEASTASAPTAAAAAADQQQQQKSVPIFLSVVALLLWLQFFLALTFTWSNGKYYHYGWVVPLLVALCFWRQWQTEDDVAGSAKASTPSAPGRGMVIGTVLVLVAVTLLRILELSDPGWRVPLWFHALILSVYSCWLLIALIGAQKAKGFLFVGILALTAVPLPSMLEMGLVDRLSQWVVEAAGSVLSLLGNATEIQGTVLIVDGKKLAVDQACSGIRSFQSLFMYALFFGEFWRLNLLGRASLLAVGLALAIVTNVARVTVLTKIFLARGQDGFDAAHDWVGYVAFLVATGGLLLAGMYLEKSGTENNAERPPAA